jgi:hypothetical protein
MKKFFKPTIGIIVIFIVLIILTAFVPHTGKVCSNGPVGISCSTVSTIGLGYPVFYGEQFAGDYGKMSFNLIYFVVNIIIYYFVASLIVDKDVYKELKKRGWKRHWFFKRVLTCKALKKDGNEAFSHIKWKNYRVENDELFKNAEIIDGVPFMELNEYLRYKRCLPREKDKKDVKLMEKYLSRKIKTDIKFRIPQINLATSYIYAAEAISQEIKIHRDLPDKEWRNQITIIPLLFLLRQALELALKSIFISYDKDYETEHDLKKLVNDAEQLLKNDRRKGQVPFNVSQWEKAKKVIEDVAETKYDGEKRMFKKDDVNSTILRYLQDDDYGSYSKLKNIPYDDLIMRVKEAVGYCEVFTINEETGGFYQYRDVSK